jgi:hypothetical protein
MSQKVYFPQLKKSVASYVANCLICQEKNHTQTDQRHTLVTTNDGFPFQRISIDFVGPLQPSTTGCKFLLTVKDTFSRWMEAFPIVNATALEVAAKLESEIFCRYGVPEVIHSDQGRQFTSRVMQSLARVMNIKLTVTPAYNPKSNPVERAHRDLGAMLRALCRDQPGNWQEVLPQALFAMRTAVNTSTGLAPYQLLFGRDASVPLDLAFGSPPAPARGDLTFDVYATKLRARIGAASAYARKNMSKAVIRQRRRYVQDKQLYVENAEVWLFTPVTKPGGSRKLATYWTGPWLIHKKINDLIYTLQPSPILKEQNKLAKETTVSIDRLKPYYPGTGADPNVLPILSPHDLDMDGDEFAEYVDVAQDVSQSGHSPSSHPLPQGMVHTNQKPNTTTHSGSPPQVTLTPSASLPSLPPSSAMAARLPSRQASTPSPYATPPQSHYSDAPSSEPSHSDTFLTTTASHASEAINPGSRYPTRTRRPPVRFGQEQHLGDIIPDLDRAVEDLESTASPSSLYEDDD